MKRRRQSTPEQIKAREEKQAKFRAIAKRIADMSDEERDRLSMSLPQIMTCQGHALSRRNTMLLHFQSEAPCTLVGGFRQWIKQGRVVMKGQRGMTILFPKTKGEKPNPDNIDQASETAAAAEQRNGKRSSIPFLTGTVFDVSQTEELTDENKEQTETPSRALFIPPPVEAPSPTLTIWNSDGTDGPCLICPPPTRVIIIDKPPPGGWTDADKVRKPTTPQVPALAGMSPLGITPPQVITEATDAEDRAATDPNREPAKDAQWELVL